VIIACKSYRTKNPQNTEILRAVSLNQGRLINLILVKLCARVGLFPKHIGTDMNLLGRLFY